MKLFTKDINNKLFKQYPLGSNLEKQVAVAKVFNPYGDGRWFLLNSDPEDPDYIWAIVQMNGEVEMGSISRKELETLKVGRWKLPLERDLGFQPINALKLMEGLRQGKFYKDGGWVEYAMGGAVKWQDADFGDSALVVSENKMGIIMKPYGRKFHLKFVDGTEKTYDASELKFFKDMDEFDRGGKTNKRYKVSVYYGGEMEDEEIYADTLEEARKISQRGEHSEIYDTEKKEFVMAKGGGTSSPNIEFMKWYLDWLKSVNKYVYVSMSIPNEFSSPVKDNNGKIVILDVIEKKGDADAKKYMNEILKKADEFGVSIYLEPIPRTHNLKSQEHKKKITKDYLIKYYEKFGFENTDGGFMVREPKMAEGGMMADGGEVVSKKLVNSIVELFKKETRYEYKKPAQPLYSLPARTEIRYAFKIDTPSGRSIWFRTKYFGDWKDNIQVAYYKGDNYFTIFQGDNEIKTNDLSALSNRLKELHSKKVEKHKNYLSNEYLTDSSLNREIAMLLSDKMGMGGKVKFKDKVEAIKASLLKRKKVPAKVQKDYGKTFSPAEAEDSAKRIVGAMTAKERLKAKLKN